MLTPDRLPTWENSYRFDIFLEIDEDGNGFWVARHPELLGCLGQGDSPEEALASLQEARALYLEGLEKEQVAPPDVEDYRQQSTPELAAAGAGPA